MWEAASRPVHQPKTLLKKKAKRCSGSISESTICKPKKAAFRRRPMPIRSRIAEKGLKAETANNGSGRRILSQERVTRSCRESIQLGRTRLGSQEIKMLGGSDLALLRPELVFPLDLL